MLPRISKKGKDFNAIAEQISLLRRDLGFLTERIFQNLDTQFETTPSDQKKVLRALKKARKEISNAMHSA